jgi:hypothetical protein
LRRKGRLKHVIEGKIEGRIEEMGRRERRCQQILDILRKRQDSVNRKRKQYKFDVYVTVHRYYNNINNQLGATITVY